MLSLVKSDINGVVSLCHPLEIPIEHLPFSLRRPGILGKRHPVRFYECLEMNRFLSLGAQCHQLIHDCLEDSNSIVIKHVLSFASLIVELGFDLINHVLISFIYLIFSQY